MMSGSPTSAPGWATVDPPVRTEEADAMAKVGIPTFSGWAFVLVAGVVLALIAIVDRGGFEVTASASDGSTGCQLEVTTDQLNVRSGPSQEAELLRTLARGARVDGTRIQTNFYRQLEDGTWAVSEFLTPLPGSNCG
jgi:hypothetical protein